MREIIDCFGHKLQIPSREEIRAEVIDEIANKSFCEWTNCEDCAMWGQYDEFGVEEVCILEQLKEQK